MEAPVSASGIPLDTSLPIFQVVPATMKAMIPRQLESLAGVHARGTVSMREFSCGPHERNKLDLFLPTSFDGHKRPLVLFAFGGGFTTGDKRLPPSQGSIYLNVGNYFVEQAGMAAITINYRLFPEHQAKYPSGGEDVALALKWLAETDDAQVKEKVDLNNIFLMGTSAGAFHTGTYLWCPESKRTWDPPPSNITVRGYLCFNLPASFHKAEESRWPVLKGYLGQDLAENDAVTMRRDSRDKTPTLVVWSDHDLPTEVMQPLQDLLKVWSETPQDVPRPDTLVLQGHNHFSPAMALGLGGPDDAWTESMLAWMRKIMQN